MRTSDTSYGTQGSTTHRRRRVMARATRRYGYVNVFTAREGLASANVRAWGPRDRRIRRIRRKWRIYDIRQNPP